MRTLNLALLATALTSAALVIATPRDARACGGCFHQIAATPSESTVVTDHRMAFALSTQQTVLWDQIKYAGNPQEFVWVLPVHPGTRIELSHDQWLAALDASTQPIIHGPAQYYGGGATGDGCGCLLSSASNASALADDESGDASVQIVTQDVVGPYETVTLRATDPNALSTWLVAHGYDIPAAVQPIVDAYTIEGFDFIALRLRPGEGVRAMQPVRVVSPGADPSLPLRMVAAGAGQNVGLTLYVLGEGRYQAQNFPNATIDATKLVWSNATSSSNYQTLIASVMGQENGRTWVTEYAEHATVFTTGGGFVNGTAPVPGPIATSGNPTLADAYFAGCGEYAPPYTFQSLDHVDDLDGSDDADASDDAATDAAESADASGKSDASHDAGSREADAGSDAAAEGDGGTPACTGACCDFDDLNVAMTGLHASDVVVTRLRAFLPVQALAVGDLRLTAGDQAPITNVYTATTAPQTTTGAGLAPRSPSTAGTIATILAALFALGSILRRRRGQS